MDQLNRERDRAAENALEAIAELRRELDSAEKNLRSAADGGPVRADVPRPELAEAPRGRRVHHRVPDPLEGRRDRREE
jgi:hypothetical protein